MREHIVEKTVELPLVVEKIIEKPVDVASVALQGKIMELAAHMCKEQVIEAITTMKAKLDEQEEKEKKLKAMLRQQMEQNNALKLEFGGERKLKREPDQDMQEQCQAEL